jgi:cyclic beta-1,2-glucan synthetase
MESYFVPDVTSETASVLEHCMRTLRITETTGVHGLPLMGCGDWNDGMNEVGRHLKGESVWLGWFQIEVIQRFIPVLRALAMHDVIENLEARAQSLKVAVEAHAWDGQWYHRAYYDDGTPIGSAANEECKIDSLAQSWGVISGAADPQRSKQAMNAVFEYLVDRQAGLIKVLTPAFDTSPKNPGYIKGYPPGIRENGGQYTHAAAWVVIACAMMGRGADAFALFDLVNPMNHTNSEQELAVYKAEPYVLCGDVYSEAPFRGRAGWSWYTGSSGWFYQAGLEHILGVRVLADRIELNPCVPREWGNFTVTYRREGTVIEIMFDNSAGVERGVKHLSVDGVEIALGYLPLLSLDGKARVKVVVVMG